MTSKIEIREVSDKDLWERFLLSKNPGTFLQSWNWGETNKSVGYKVTRLGIFSGKDMIGCAQVIDQPARRGHHLLIPGGPVFDYFNKDIFQILVNYLKVFAKKEKAWFIRIRPDVKDSEELRVKLRKFDFISAPMHVHGEHTLVLDILPPEEKILQDMRKTTRYLIRKSMTEGFTMRTSKDKKDAEILDLLQRETVKRHKFVGFRKKLFEAQLKSFGKDNQALLFICEKDEIPLVSAIIIFYSNKAFYHHSGSSESARNTNASYYTQWEIIKKAKKEGYSMYDFWGIAPTEDPKHRFAGVTVFKKGFGGERIDWVHAHDLPVSKLYWLTYVFETLRRRLRNL